MPNFILALKEHISDKYQRRMQEVYVASWFCKRINKEVKKYYDAKKTY